MAETDPNELQSGDPQAQLVWPSPPYFELPDSDTTATPEQCVIDLSDGTQQRFMPPRQA